MMRGVILLELLISILIAGFISTGLLTTIFQINRVLQTVNTITHVNNRLAILQNQLERDVMGAFIPAQVDMIQTSTLKQAQQKSLEKIFYGTSKGNGGRLELLTFITSSPLEIFFGVKNIILKPHVARVVYRLVPDSHHKNSYILMRQEGTTTLSFENYKMDATGELRSFAMIDGIQNLTVKYVTIQQEAMEETRKQKLTYKKSSVWQSEAKKSETPPKTGAASKAPVRLPNQIELEILLWDSTYENTNTFSFIIPIISQMSEFEQPPKKPAEGEKNNTPALQKGVAQS